MEKPMVRTRRAIASAVLGSLVVSSCNSDSPTAGIDRGGARVAVVAQGPITGFGSIVVGGVHYDVSTAAIEIDRATASESQLALGQLVTVVGERDETGSTGTADSVVFQADVRGAIQAVDATASEVLVLEQRVLIGGATVLDLGSQAPNLASLDIGEIVEVSGFITSDGAIDATRVASVPAQAPFLVAGSVTNVDTSLLRFAVRDLTVDYSAALVIEGFPAGHPVNGDRVVVVGSLSPATGRFMARELERDDAEESEDIEGREAEVEGRITRFGSSLDFDVAGRRVTASPSTVYEGGGAATLALDLKVHVAGTFDSSGVIRALKIEIED
jgi:hypothetical protein